MDAFPLLTASIPSYFVIGPLVVILVLLVVLIGKKDTPKESIVVQAPTPIPVTEVISPAFVQPQATVAPAQVINVEHAPVVASVLIQEAVSAAQAPVAIHEPIMPQQPELTIVPPVPLVPPTPMPPISSWKPAAPTPMAAGDLIGESEGALQIKAVAQEVSPIIEKVESRVEESVAVTGAVSPQETILTENSHAVADVVPVPEPVAQAVVQAVVEVKA